MLCLRHSEVGDIRQYSTASDLRRLVKHQHQLPAVPSLKGHLRLPDADDHTLNMPIMGRKCIYLSQILSLPLRLLPRLGRQSRIACSRIRSKITPHRCHCACSVSPARRSKGQKSYRHLK